MIIKYNTDPWLYPVIGEGKAVKDITEKVGDIIVCFNFLKSHNGIIVMYGNVLDLYYSSI